MSIHDCIPRNLTRNRNAVLWPNPRKVPNLRQTVAEKFTPKIDNFFKRVFAALENVHISAGIFTRIACYPLPQNSSVEMCQFIRIAITDSNVSVFATENFLRTNIPTGTQRVRFAFPFKLNGESLLIMLKIFFSCWNRTELCLLFNLNRKITQKKTIILRST